MICRFCGADLSGGDLLHELRCDGRQGRIEAIADFDGETYEAERDHDRLAVQLTAVRVLMRDGQWRTLHEIAVAVAAPEASVSARLRDLRKEKFGGYTVERTYVDHGLYRYRLIVHREAS